MGKLNIYYRKLKAKAISFRKLLLLIIIIMNTGILTAQDNFYLIKDTTSPINQYLNPWPELYTGARIFPLYEYHFWNQVLTDRKNEGVFLGYTEDKKAINYSNLMYIFSGHIQIPGSELLPENISTITVSAQKRTMWIPAYYKDILIAGEKLVLSDYYPHIKEKMISQNIFFPTIIYIQNTYILIVDASSHTLLFPILNITKTGKNSYKVYTADISDDIWYQYSYHQKPQNPLLFNEIKSDYANILYLYYTQKHIIIFKDLNDGHVLDMDKINNTLHTKIFNLLKMKNFRVNSELNNSDLFSDTEEYNIPEIKDAFQIKTNRNKQFKTSKDTMIYSIPKLQPNKAIRKMKTGEKLSFINSGNHAKLGRKKAPWMHVETEEGIRGWIWGGFLEEIEAEPFVPTHKVTESLRLRSDSNTSSKTITVMKAEQLVKLLEEGDTETIDEIPAPWLKIETEDGDQGWCFGGYMELIEKESPERLVGKINPVLLLILISTGILIIAVLLILIFKRKRK